MISKIAIDYRIIQRNNTMLQNKWVKMRLGFHIWGICIVFSEIELKFRNSTVFGTFRTVTTGHWGVRDFFLKRGKPS